MDAVFRFAVMVLQVDEAAGELDEGFVKNMAPAVRSEPDMLEDIVRGVIFPIVEQAEVFEVARMPRGIRFPAGELRGDFVVLAHGSRPKKPQVGAGGQGKTGLAGMAARKR